MENNNNKSIASRWFNNVNPPKEQQPQQQPVQPQVEQPKENNPVRHQYRQTVLNGLKGESYV